MKLATALFLSLLLATPTSAWQKSKSQEDAGQGKGKRPTPVDVDRGSAKDLETPRRAGTDRSRGRDQRPEPAKLEPLSLDGVRPLTKIGRVLLAGQPGPAAMEALIQGGVDRVIDLRTEGEDRGFDEPARVEALGAKYASLPFGGPVPLTDTIIDDVRKALRRYRSEGKGKLLIHCASSNRVGGVWLAARVLDEGVPWEVALEQAKSAGLRSQKYIDYVRLYVLGGGNHELGEWIEKIRKEYPDVKGISVREFARIWKPGMKSDASKLPLLIDVRKPAEFEVSHIRGAKNAPSPEAIKGLLRDVPKDREIVVYCSIGVRSAKMAKELASMGYRNVRNLEGSVFEWANTGHPVFRGDKRVHEVHPFDEEWGRMLRRDLWADAAKK